MVERVLKLVKTELREIINTPLILELLDVYSKLYLNGGQPGYCEKCINNYYLEIMKNGMELAEKYELVKKRTCKPSWKGLKYIPVQARHFNSEMLTDDEACNLLIDGKLRESDFDKLPVDYVNYKKELESEGEILPKKTKKSKK